MEPLIMSHGRFRLGTFLTALHRFSLAHGGDGNPLPVVVGDLVYHDPVDLDEALADDERVVEIPDDSLTRLEAGLTLYGQFTAFDGFAALDSADGKQIKVRGEDEGDECVSFGFAISLVGDVVEIEGRSLSDVSGECELEPLTEPNRVVSRMRRWVRTFVIANPRRKGK